MKNKIQKNILILFLILTLSLANFFVIGINVRTYAANNIATNHANVEFDAYFKTTEGTQLDSTDIAYAEENTYLYIHLGIKDEGYFNGEIAVASDVLEFVESENTEINEITSNKIVLHQINAGSIIELKIKVKLNINSEFNILLLNAISNISLKGIYRDSTEKDIIIEANRDVKTNIIEYNNEENIINNINIITNKVVEIEGLDKRIVQLEAKIGAIQNYYPIEKIDLSIKIPKINEELPTVEVSYEMNNMTSYEHSFVEDIYTINLKNQVDENNIIKWNTESGEEKVILTLIYDGSTELTGEIITLEEKVSLYSENEITKNSEVQIEKELDSIVQISSINNETSIYKGNLYADKTRNINTTTVIKFNYPAVVNSVNISELASQYVLENTNIDANVYYNSTIINKQNMLDILGEEGTITIYDEQNRTIANITNDTEVNENGDIIVNYENISTKAIGIKTTNPIKQGVLTINHSKRMEQVDNNVEKEIKELLTITGLQYNVNSINESEVLSVENKVKMEETTTEMEFNTNKETLSTAITNNLEMNIELLTNDEKFDLYENPKITVEMPSQVTNIEINSVDLLYDNNLSIKGYAVDGRNINIELQGKQTDYSAETLNGASLKVDVNVDLDKTAASSTENITLTYLNDRANLYNSPNMGIQQQQIDVKATNDVTIVNSVESLNIDEVGENEENQVVLDKGVTEVQLTNSFEVINNNEENIENIKVMVNLPTNNTNNNLGVKLLTGINISGGKDIEIYNTENENATSDLTNTSNGWTQGTANAVNIKKYLVVIGELSTKTTMTGSYTFSIPENLEYNKEATTSYSVEYTNSLTGMTKELKSTPIKFTSGVGPVIENEISATIGGQPIVDAIKTGEIIKYRIVTKNIGTEIANNVEIIGNIPENTKLVEPKDDYVYDGTTYYNELTDTEVRSSISTLNPNEELVLEYEVRVIADGVSNTEISNSSKVEYAGVTSNINNLTHDVEEGKLQIEVKKITDTRFEVTENSSISYYVSVKNISGQTQNDVEVEHFLSDFVQVESLELLKFINDEGEIETNKLQYDRIINIGTLQSGEEKVLAYDMLIGNVPDGISTKTFSATGTVGTSIHKSNIWNEEVIKYNVEVDMSTSAENYVEIGEEIDYTIVVKNNNITSVPLIDIKANIPEQLEIQKVTVGNEVKDIEYSNNEFFDWLSLQPNETITIVIETIVDRKLTTNELEPISTMAILLANGSVLAESQEVNNIIETRTVVENNDVENNDIATGNKTITGLAWLDDNNNGKKDKEEESLSGIRVKLLNIDTNNFVKTTSGNELVVTTNSTGVYILNNIGNGRYIAVFEYDAQYTLTKYEVSGVADSENSNVALNELNIGETTQMLPSTDILNINNNDILNINIGLIEAQIFDLELDKFISKIIIQNSNGTKQTEYSNASLTRIELDADEIQGTTAIIEYELKITNNGEIEGYAKEIIDYIPSNLQFSSELNKTWYETTEGLANRSLEDEVILPGETKVISLVLIKDMTKENTGLINNTAEIKEAYNELGINDIDSTPGNKNVNEDDYSFAEVIISIRTGGGIYIALILSILGIAVMSTVIILIIKKRKNI